MKKVLLLLANGFEDIEAVTAMDLLKRAGIDVVTAGVPDKDVESSRGLRVDTDFSLDEILDDFDAIVLPGGMPGAKNLAESGDVMNILKKMSANHRLIAAICAAPGLVLGKTGLLRGRRFTCYPGFENLVEDAYFTDSGVVCDGNFITGAGPGYASEFSFALIDYLVGDLVSDRIRKETFFKD